MPWVESPEDAKRAADAASAARKISPPQVSVAFEEGEMPIGDDTADTTGRVGSSRLGS
jgi:hypothetical protein